MSNKKSITNTEKYEYPAVGERIKTVRESLGLKQTEVASVLGCKQSTISKYEKGMTLPADILFGMSKLFNKSIYWIWGESAQLPDASEPFGNGHTNEEPDKDEDKILELWNTLDNDEQNALVTLLKRRKR